MGSAFVVTLTFYNFFNARTAQLRDTNFSRFFFCHATKTGRSCVEISNFLPRTDMKINDDV